MTAAEIVNLVIQGVSAILSLATQLGQRDAALSALDAVLASARAETDAALYAKHNPA